MLPELIGLPISSKCGEVKYMDALAWAFPDVKIIVAHMGGI